ncbi:acetolactate synthase small subunit [Buchnera aphidicola]|uniref:acetolactate synthase small subunit n=1 Tax=Buchnera aphidicola TaxID=9 RepID=UPI0031B84A7D
MKTILSVLLENEFGALSRVIGLFSQRGYNIDSLNVAPTQDPTLSLLTIKTIGNKRCIEQIKKQLNKLIDVLKVVKIKKNKYISREIILIKIKKKYKKKINKKKTKKKFKYSIINKNKKYLILQKTGNEKKINKFIKKIKNKIKIKKISRSGIINISK